MKRKTANIDIRVEAPLIEKIDSLARPAASTAKPLCGDCLHARAIPQA
jgi:hypothetical protein